MAGTLAVVAALASIGLAAGNPLRAMLGLLLVLWLPGYALARAAIADSSCLDGQLALVSLGLSVATTAVTGLALNLLPAGLTASALGCTLAAITVAGACVAFTRRSSVDAERGSFSRALPLLQRVLVVGLAAAIAGFAVALAHHGARTISVPRFTELSALPMHSDGAVQIRIANREGRDLTYRLEVRNSARRLIRRATIRVASQGQRTFFLGRNRASAARGGTVLLYRGEASRNVYRRVSIPTRSGKRP